LGHAESGGGGLYEFTPSALIFSPHFPRRTIIHYGENMSETEWPEVFPLDGTPPYDFSCSREEQNNFLRDRAWPEQQDGLSVTYLAHLNGITVGFMTLAMDAITLQTSEKPRSIIRLVRFPAVKVAQLAIHKNWERRGLGQKLVALAAGIALDLRSRVGCRYLTVDAKPDVVSWYRAQEFKVNKEERKAREQRAAGRGIPAESLPVSMRLDLFSLLQDLHDRFPRDFQSG
jgi:GNAT superfamily N-acetyltransferase